MAPSLLSPAAFGLFGLLVEFLLLMLVYGASRDVASSMAGTMAGIWLAVAADNVRAYREANQLSEGVWGLLWTLLFFGVIVVAAAEWSRYGNFIWFLLTYGCLALAAFPSWGLRGRVGG